MRKVDVLTAQEDEAITFSDPELLDRATHLGRALFTFDADLLAESSARLLAGTAFAGVLYAHPQRISIGQCVQDLQVIALAGEPEDLWNRSEFLPLSRTAK